MNKYSQDGFVSIQLILIGIFIIIGSVVSGVLYFTKFKPEQIQTQKRENIEQNIEAPKILFVLDGSSCLLKKIENGFDFDFSKQNCLQSNINAKFQILRDGQSVAKVNSPFGVTNDIYIFGENNKSFYFSFRQGERGEYAVFDNLFRLNFSDNSVELIKKGRDIYLSKDLRKVAYTDTGIKNDIFNIVIKDLNSNNEQIFSELSVILDDAWSKKSESAEELLWKYFFSPHNDKLAIVVGYWPPESNGLIYVLNLDSKIFSLYQKTDNYFPDIDWKNENDLIWR